MVIVKKVLILSFLLICLTCCKKITRPDDVLSLAQQSYSGDQLRLDGIYFMEYETSEGILYQRYALFHNGIIRHLGGGPQWDSEFLSGDKKRHWGLFQIDSTNIKFERWYPSSGGAVKAYIRAGVILSDTAFHITESYRNQNGKKTEVKARNEIYHFKQISPKPDSTNAFVN